MRTSRFICAVVSLVVFNSSALASDCDALVAQLLTGVPGLTFTNTSHVAGAPNFDVAYFKHPQASQIALSCGPRQPLLEADVRPSARFDESVSNPSRQQGKNESQRALRFL